MGFHAGARQRRGWLPCLRLFDVIVDTHDKAQAVLDSKINELKDNLSDPRPDYDLRKRGFELRNAIGRNAASC